MSTDGYAATRPASCTNQWVSLLGVVGFLVAFAYARGLELDRADFALVCMAGCALPMILVDLTVLKVHRRPTAGLLFGEHTPGMDLKRVAIKLLGLGVTLLALAGLYLLFPEYDKGNYQPFWTMLQRYLPWMLAGAVPYFAYVDAHMAEPRDGNWMVGALVLGRWDEIDRHKLKHHVLGWVIKGFYLPLMFIYMGSGAVNLAAYDLERVFTSPAQFVIFITKLSLAVDVAFGAIGYCLTLRLIDAHIRSTNPLMYGWVFTLALYQPFWGLLGNRYFDYGDGRYWNNWVGDIAWLYVLWAALIVIAKFGWVWANASFGCRFSNLTHRGIMTGGPYRLTKHPSYVNKNVAWWLMSVPFLSLDGYEYALRHSILLFGVNLLYFTRARAEEAHLSEDPVYVEYALWVNDHGLFARLNRLIPFLRYKPPQWWLDQREAEAGASA